MSRERTSRQVYVKRVLELYGKRPRRRPAPADSTVAWPKSSTSGK
jgi:hypothetical protein